MWTFVLHKNNDVDSAPVVPAAQGELRAMKNRNKHYEVAVSVKSLAEAKSLTLPKEPYAVQMKSERNGIKNIEQIISSSWLLSSNKIASLKAVTSFEPTSVFKECKNNETFNHPVTNWC